MLQILKASAGSGKTFRLTFEYIRLLFDIALRASTSPDSYRDSQRLGDRKAHRRILAVTFTNKATDEMKSRILTELNALASGEQSPYRPMLCREFELDEQALNEQAQQILIAILHDYSFFAVSTIDRFFQQIMRSFTREIGLQGGYNVELDQQRVAEEAINQLLAGLAQPENKQLLDWLTLFAENKMEEGKNWDFRKNIVELSSQLFKEEYMQAGTGIVKKLDDKDFLKQYQAKLRVIVARFEKEAETLALRALDIIARNGLTTADFKYGRASGMNFLNKLTNKDFSAPPNRFAQLPDNLDEWSLKTTSPEQKKAIETAYHNGLNECVGKIISLFEQESRDYNTAQQILRNFYTLGILADIDRQMRRYLNEQNLMLLSDSNQLLNLIIDGSDTPFLYEKVGVRLDHFMIDEFQDTSQMQWQNFYPLIANSLAQRSYNLIVGDVKQSIYRWRNSDWKLLDEQLALDFRPEQRREDTLQTNYRSDRHIVEFNNAFFKTAAQTLQDEFNRSLSEVEGRSLSRRAEPVEAEVEAQSAPASNKILHAYADLEQQLPESKPDGHVRIEFIEAEDCKNEALNRLPETLETLQDSGHRLNEIAILVRTRQEGKDIADFLLRHKQSAEAKAGYRYDIISDEALVIANARSVKFLVGMMRRFAEPENQINQALTAFEYERLINRLPPDRALQQMAHTELWSADVSELRHASLFEMTEGLIGLFRLGETTGESLYIQAFQDLVYDFTSRNTGDPLRFLEWWDESGCEKTLATSETQDAVRILTVHKSKGLGFGVVIMPFCDWKIDQKADAIVWCRPQTAPFNELGLLPMNYSAMKNTVFYEEYLNEKLHSCIDNLNLIYVAFTRAKHELIAFCPKKEKPDTVAGLLNAYCAEEEVFELGNFAGADYPSTTLRERKSSVGADLQSAPSTGTTEMPLYVSSSSRDRLRLKLQSAATFDPTDHPRLAQLHYGTLMHELLTGIRYEADLAPALEQMQRKGRLNAEERQAVEQKIQALWENLPETHRWFSSEWRVITEGAIITPQGETFRPDRIIANGEETLVIDYKFGLAEAKAHRRQVANYIRLVSAMGFPRVSGCLCYAELGKVVQLSGFDT